MTHSDHVVAMETVSETWLVTAGSDGQSSTLVSGFDAMKDEVIRCMWPDMDGGEEADDMRAEMDDPEFWEGDHWSCGWSFEDGYINVQRVLASRLAKQGWQTIDTAPKDGTVILAVASQAQTPKARPAWWDGEGWVRIWKSEDFVVDGPRRWWPTHWQHMPAAPSPVLGEPK